MLRSGRQKYMVNRHRTRSLNVKVMMDTDHTPFLSVVIYDRADKGDEHRACAIADGLLGARITVISVHNLLSFTLLHGRAFLLTPTVQILLFPYPSHISSAPVPLLSSPAH
jgi:hypothetical protein